MHMHVDKCTLYLSLRTEPGSTHNVDVSVEGRKTLCEAASSALMSFADDRYSRAPAVRFELTFGANTSWIIEAHCFQVWRPNFNFYTRPAL